MRRAMNCGDTTVCLALAQAGVAVSAAVRALSAWRWLGWVGRGW